jgi:hypothetical protein
MSRTSRVHPLPGSAGRIERTFRPSPWIVLVGGIVTTLAVLFVVTRLTSANAYTPLFAGGPRAQISQTAFDYGDVKNNTQVKTTFTIQNVGDKQLYFPTEPVVQVVEGCCPPLAQIDRSELDPGETANVSLSFSMHEGMDGPHDFRVKVRTNDVVEPEQEVVVLSNWVP